MKFLSISVLLLFALVSFAQKLQTAASSESDPEAKAVLDKVRRHFEAYKSIEIDFSLLLEIPEQDKKVEKGKLSQVGKQYRLELPAQTFICDGKSLWVLLKDKKEVQINDVEDQDEESISPQDLLRIYERKDFAFVLVQEYPDSKKRMLQQIEMKPLDRSADYSKLRLEIDKKTGDIVSVKVFFKDGVRYTITVEKITPDKTFATTHFSYQAKDYPGYRVEDLRID